MNNPDRPRTYRQTARAAAAAATAERILDAAVAAFWERPDDTPLEEIARRAGVSVQTVIRRFGGRDGLMAAAIEREAARVAAARDTTVVRTPAQAAAQLVDHYESMGDRVLVLLAEEARQPSLAALAERGRRFHRTWCEAAFAGALARLERPTRERRLAQLVAVCDVYTWKLLRRDAGLDRTATELALVELLEPLLEPPLEAS